MIQRVFNATASLLLLIGPFAQAQSSQQDEWREILQFGIDSQVQSLLPQLEQSGVTDMDDPLVSRFVASRGDDLREAIIEYFQRRDSDALVEPVRTLLLAEQEPSDQVIRAAASYLSSQAAEIDDQLLDLFIELVDDSGVLTATVAIEAIGASGSPGAVQRLIDLYEGQQNSDVRASILRALGQTGSEQALPLLTSIAEDEFEQSALRHYATESIGRIGSPESVALLTGLLSSPDSVLRAYATLALGFYPPETSASALTDALLDSFWRVRVAALQGLSEQANTAAVPAIAFKARRDPERPVRAEAIETLGSIATPEALEALAEIARNNRLAETERMLALSQLIAHDAGMFEDLLTEIVEEEWERDGSRVLDTIGKELSTAGEPSLAELYLRFLEHPNFVIRVYAIRALGAARLTAEQSRLKTLADENEGLIRTTALAALEKMGITYEPSEEEAVDEARPDEVPPGDSDAQTDW